MKYLIFLGVLAIAFFTYCNMVNLKADVPEGMGVTFANGDHTWCKRVEWNMNVASFYQCDNGKGYWRQTNFVVDKGDEMEKLLRENAKL